MKKIFIIAVLLSAGFTSYSQDAQYTSKVKQMLMLTGAEQTFATAVDQMIVQMKTLRTEVSSETWDELQTEFKKTSIDDLVSLLSPVYARYLDESDIDGIIAFYQTPIGRKYAQHTPAITQESMIAGQEWGMKIGQKIADRLTEEGY